jgi:hypothetical protein
MKFLARKAREFAQFTFMSKVSANEKDDLPEFFLLYQNFPNPFNSSTAIQYDLILDSHVKLTVYNIFGQKVKTLLDENQSAGSHSAIWDGTNALNAIIASGVYFYKIEAGEVIHTKKMIFMK